MDWFQLESSNAAEKLNEMLNGWEIERKYHSPRLSRTNGEFHWNKKE